MCGRNSTDIKSLHFHPHAFLLKAKDPIPQAAPQSGMGINLSSVYGAFKKVWTQNYFKKHNPDPFWSRKLS